MASGRSVSGYGLVVEGLQFAHASTSPTLAASHALRLIISASATESALAPSSRGHQKATAIASFDSRCSAMTKRRLIW